MRILGFILLLTVGFTPILSAEPVPSNKGGISSEIPLIPRKLLFGNPEKAAPQISPNGKKLAYLAPDENNVLNVWIRDLKHPHSKDKMVTSDPKRGIRSFMWQLDSEHILYNQDQDGDENSHLYQTNISNKKTKDLTPFEGVKAEILTYNVKFPDEILVLLNKRDRALFDVYRIDLKTGDIQLDTENPDQVFNWLADHQLNVRIAASYTKDGALLIRVRDDKEPNWRELMTIDPLEINGGVVSFAADNRHFYLLSSLEGDTCRLLKVDSMTGRRELIVQDPQFDLDDLMQNPSTHKLEAIGVNRERYDWIVLDKSLAADFTYLRQQSKGVFHIINRDLDNKIWVVSFHSDQQPTDFYLYHRPNQKLQFLFTTQPELKKYPLSPMKPITFTAKDGMKIYGYLTLPVGKEPKNLPTILFVHGGPWARDSWGLNPTVQWFANRGYAVLQINFRGSTGYGKAYVNAGDREWGAKMHQDLLDGKQWMVDEGYADPNKVAIYGGSYGGYATLAALAFTPNEFNCGVDIVGPSNLTTLLKTIPPYWGPLKTQMDRRVGKLETEEDFLKSRSPLFKADQIQRPLLIAQGANDPRVKQSESDQIVSAMREHKLPVEYLLFKDEGHGFARPENRLKFQAATEEFLSKYLGGRCEPAHNDENWDALKQ